MPAEHSGICGISDPYSYGQNTTTLRPKCGLQARVWPQRPKDWVILSRCALPNSAQLPSCYSMCNKRRWNNCSVEVKKSQHKRLTKLAAVCYIPCRSQTLNATECKNNRQTFSPSMGLLTGWHLSLYEFIRHGAVKAPWYSILFHKQINKSTSARPVIG